MRSQSTAHVIRGDAGSRRGELMDLAAGLAPVGFDPLRDGVCIHRAGTILFLSRNALGLLAVPAGEEMVGRSVVDLFQPADQAAVVSAIDRASRGDMASARVSIPGALQLTAVRAGEAVLPVDLLYVRPYGRGNVLCGENELLMAIHQGERTKKGGSRPTVLICDDEARLGALTAGLLTEYGFAPITVGTGDEALRALAGHDPEVDVLLLDVNLSAGRSARDVLVAMRENGTQARVILTSGLAEEDVDADLVSHPSVVGYVAKPYGVDQLVQTINKALGRRPD